MKKTILFLICCVLTMMMSSHLHAAALTTKPATLGAEDQNDINRLESYLNELKSISANFMQIDDQGGVMHGTIAIKRPGKMRVTYDPPSKDFIVADGETVHIWNDDLKSQTNVDEASSLAEFILRDPIKLTGKDVIITSLKHYPAKIEITLLQANDPGSGQLTLIFEDNPLLLRQWRVIDAEGRSTGVNLENEQMDVSFSPSTFSFVPPSFGKSGKSGG